MKAYPTLFLALVLAAPATAELYQWKDENGQVHFSDKKPGSGSVTTLQQPASPRRSGQEKPVEEISPQDRQRRLLQVIEQEAEQKEKERLGRQREQENRESECNRLRAHQRDIAGHPVFRTDTKDENGDRIFLGDKERDEYDQRIAALIAQKCQ